MMLAGAALKGFAIEASDGRIGTVGDFHFDDATMAKPLKAPSSIMLQPGPGS